MWTNRPVKPKTGEVSLDTLQEQAKHYAAMQQTWGHGGSWGAQMPYGMLPAMGMHMPPPSFGIPPPVLPLSVFPSTIIAAPPPPPPPEEPTVTSAAPPGNSSIEKSTPVSRPTMPGPNKAWGTSTAPLTNPENSAPDANNGKDVEAYYTGYDTNYYDPNQTYYGNECYDYYGQDQSLQGYSTSATERNSQTNKSSAVPASDATHLTGPPSAISVPRLGSTFHGSSANRFSGPPPPQSSWSQSQKPDEFAAKQFNASVPPPQRTNGNDGSAVVGKTGGYSDLPRGSPLSGTGRGTSQSSAGLSPSNQNRGGLHSNIGLGAAATQIGRGRIEVGNLPDNLGRGASMHSNNTFPQSNVGWLQSQADICDNMFNSSNRMHTGGLQLNAGGKKSGQESIDQNKTGWGGPHGNQYEDTFAGRGGFHGNAGPGFSQDRMGRGMNVGNLGRGTPQSIVGQKGHRDNSGEDLYHNVGTKEWQGTISRESNDNSDSRRMAEESFQGNRDANRSNMSREASQGTGKAAFENSAGRGTSGGIVREDLSQANMGRGTRSNPDRGAQIRSGIGGNMGRAGQSDVFNDDPYSDQYSADIRRLSQGNNSNRGSHNSSFVIGMSEPEMNKITAKEIIDREKSSTMDWGSSRGRGSIHNTENIRGIHQSDASSTSSSTSHGSNQLRSEQANAGRGSSQWGGRGRGFPFRFPGRNESQVNVLVGNERSRGSFGHQDEDATASGTFDSSQSYQWSKGMYGDRSDSADIDMSTESYFDEANDEDLIEFDKQFTNWENQFQKWQVDNKNHPDKSALRKYEEDMQRWKNELLKKREVIKQSKIDNLAKTRRSEPTMTGIKSDAAESMEGLQDWNSMESSQGTFASKPQRIVADFDERSDNPLYSQFQTRDQGTGRVGLLGNRPPVQDSQSPLLSERTHQDEDLRTLPLIGAHCQDNMEHIGQNMLGGRGQSMLRGRGQDMLLSRGQNIVHGRGQDSLLGKGQDALHGRGQDTLQGSVQDMMHGRGQDTLHGIGQDSLLGRGQDSLRGRGQDSLLGRGQDSLRGRGQDTLRGRGQDTMRGRGQDTMHGRGQDTMPGRGQDTMRGRGQDTMPGRGQDTMRGRGQDTMPGRGQDTMRGRGQDTMPGRGQDTMRGRGQDTMPGRGQDTMRGRGQDTMPGRGQDTMRGRGQDTMRGRGQDTMPGRGQDTMRGRGQDTMLGRGQDTMHGRGQDTLRGRGQDTLRGRGQDTMRGRGQDTMRGRGQDTMRGRGQDTMRGRGQDTMHGRGQDTMHGRGQDILRGRGQDTLRGRGQEIVRGRGQEIVRGRGQNALSGIGQDMDILGGEHSNSYSANDDTKRMRVSRWSSGQDGDCNVWPAASASGQLSMKSSVEGESVPGRQDGRGERGRGSHGKPPQRALLDLSWWTSEEEMEAQQQAGELASQESFKTTQPTNTAMPGIFDIDDKIDVKLGDYNVPLKIGPLGISRDDELHHNKRFSLPDEWYEDDEDDESRMEEPQESISTARHGDVDERVVSPMPGLLLRPSVASQRPFLSGKGGVLSTKPSLLGDGANRNQRPFLLDERGLPTQRRFPHDSMAMGAREGTQAGMRQAYHNDARGGNQERNFEHGSFGGHHEQNLSSGFSSDQGGRRGDLRGVEPQRGGFQGQRGGWRPGRGWESDDPAGISAGRGRNSGRGQRFNEISSHGESYSGQFKSQEVNEQYGRLSFSRFDQSVSSRQEDRPAKIGQATDQSGQHKMQGGRLPFEEERTLGHAQLPPSGQGFRPDNYRGQREDSRQSQYERDIREVRGPGRPMGTDIISVINKDLQNCGRSVIAEGEMAQRDRSPLRPGPSQSGSVAAMTIPEIEPDPIEDVSAEVIPISELIEIPGRFMRPPKLVIILRGPPGSGKSTIAKAIKDAEVENGGSAPRILSLDDYFMVEIDQMVTDKDTGRKTKTKVMEYEFEKELEESYIGSLTKSFKKQIDEGFFPFLIVDSVNEKVKHFQEMTAYAKIKGFEVYVAETERNLQLSLGRNIHKRSREDLETILSSWEETPANLVVVDCTSLAEVSKGEIQEVEMDDGSKSAENDVSENNSDEEDLSKASFSELIRSKWDNHETQEAKMDKLDGFNSAKKRLGIGKPKSIEDWLQLSDDYEKKSSQPGKKMVHWADMDERKKQVTARNMGFVLGQTDWNRMTDESMGSSALVQVRYIEARDMKS